MVNFHKRITPPSALASKKSYTDPDVIKALHEDFKNKCYICGSKGPTSINVEHFDEHRGDEKKKYDWNNLFYSCGHCNSVKNYTFSKGNSQLLNCTDINQKVDYWIEYRIKYDKNLKMKVHIQQNAFIFNTRFDSQIKNTIILLDKVFNGSGTALKGIEAANLSKEVEAELNRFKDKLSEYRKEKQPLIRAKLKSELTAMVAYDAPYAAFKRWFILDADLYPDISFPDIPFYEYKNMPLAIALPSGNQPTRH